MNPYAAPLHNAEPCEPDWDYSRIGLAIRILIGLGALFVVWFNHTYWWGRGSRGIDYGFFGYAEFESRFGSGSTFSIHWPNLLASVAVSLLVLCFVYSPLRLIRQLTNLARGIDAETEQREA